MDLLPLETALKATEEISRRISDEGQYLIERDLMEKADLVDPSELEVIAVPYTERDIQHPNDCPLGCCHNEPA
jgi:hypothetical protein